MWPLLSYRNSDCHKSFLGCSAPLKELWGAPPTSPRAAWECCPPAINYCLFSVLSWDSGTAAYFPTLSKHITHHQQVILSCIKPAMPSSKESAYGCGDLVFTSCFGCCYLLSFSTASCDIHHGIWVDSPSGSPFACYCYYMLSAIPIADPALKLKSIRKSVKWFRLSVLLRYTLKMFSSTYCS